MTAAEQVVTLDVALDKIALLKPGAAVEVELPDDSRVRRNVASIGRVATVKQEGAVGDDRGECVTAVTRRRRSTPHRSMSS